MPAEAGIILDRRARPVPAQRCIIIVVALISGSTACWLAHAVDGDPGRSWWLGIGVGLAVAALVAGFAMQGARITVSADGELIYSLHGRRNLGFDLRQATVLRPVGQGMLSGVGIELADPQRVRFLHKAGISPERMRRWRSGFGVDLVLEGFPPGLAAELTALRDRLPAG